MFHTILERRKRASSSYSRGRRKLLTLKKGAKFTKIEKFFFEASYLIEGRYFRGSKSIV